MDYIDLVIKCAEYLEQNMKKSISIEEVAESTCYSYPHFYRIFSDMVGDSVSGYIRKRRLSCAAEELVKSDRSICNIAFAYGFSSQQTFNRAFTGMFGIAPLQYRKKGMLDDIYKPFRFNKREFNDLPAFQVGIEELPPMKMIAYQEYSNKLPLKNPFTDREKIISRAWGKLVRGQMVCEYKKCYGKNAKIPNTVKLAEFFIKNDLHIPPHTRYFGFNNPFPCKDNEFGYETWAVTGDDSEQSADIREEAGIRIKDFSGGLYATASASYGEASNLDDTWRRLHLWLSGNQDYEYGENQWLEEHITKKGEGGFHGFKLYMAIKRKD